MSREEIKCQVVVKTICKKPGIKDNNFQVGYMQIYTAMFSLK